MNNLEFWNDLKTVPENAKKQIKGGRLKGMTDISPQWRYFAMTEKFGPIGAGWKFTIRDQWTEENSGQVCAFTNIDLFVSVGGVWSDAIPGTGGSMLAAKESAGIHVSDECFKMSLTDALSVAMKMLGVGADVYAAGNSYQESKYKEDREKTSNDKHVKQLISLGEAKKLIKAATSMDDLKTIWKDNFNRFEAELSIKDYSDIELEKDAKKAEFNMETKNG